MCSCCSLKIVCMEEGAFGKGGGAVRNRQFLGVKIRRLTDASVHNVKSD